MAVQPSPATNLVQQPPVSTTEPTDQTGDRTSGVRVPQQTPRSRTSGTVSPGEDFVSSSRIPDSDRAGGNTPGEQFSINGTVTNLELQNRKLRLAGIQNRLEQQLNQTQDTNSDSSSIRTTRTQTESIDTETEAGSSSSPLQPTPEENNRPGSTAQTSSGRNKTGPENDPLVIPRNDRTGSNLPGASNQVQQRIENINQEINEIQFRQLRTILQNATEPVSNAEEVSSGEQGTETEVTDFNSGTSDEASAIPTSVPLLPGQIVNRTG